MKTKGIRLTKDVLDAALAGGTILGGGGGGDPKKGRKYAEIAVDYTDLRLITIDDLDEDDVLVNRLSGRCPECSESVYDTKGYC